MIENKVRRCHRHRSYHNITTNGIDAKKCSFRKVGKWVQTTSINVISENIYLFSNCVVCKRILCLFFVIIRHEFHNIFQSLSNAVAIIIDPSSIRNRFQNIIIDRVLVVMLTAVHRYCKGADGNRFFFNHNYPVE